VSQGANGRDILEQEADRPRKGEIHSPAAIMRRGRQQPSRSGGDGSVTCQSARCSEYSEWVGQNELVSARPAPISSCSGVRHIQ